MAFLFNRRLAEKEKVRRRLLALVLNTPACNLERAIAEESERLTYIAAPTEQEKKALIDLGICVMLVGFTIAAIWFW